jgi:hypothetical protein
MEIKVAGELPSCATRPALALAGNVASQIGVFRNDGAAWIRSVGGLVSYSTPDRRMFGVAPAIRAV